MIYVCFNSMATISEIKEMCAEYIKMGKVEVSVSGIFTLFSVSSKKCLKKIIYEHSDASQEDLRRRQRSLPRWLRFRVQDRWEWSGDEGWAIVFSDTDADQKT